MKYIWRELGEGDLSVCHSFAFFSDRHSITLRKILLLSECLQELSLVCCSHWVSSGAGCQLTSISWSAVLSHMGLLAYLSYQNISSAVVAAFPYPCPEDVRWQIPGGTEELQAVNHNLPAKPLRGSHYWFAFHAEVGFLLLFSFPSPMHC